MTEAIVLGILSCVSGFFAWRASKSSKAIDRKTDTNHGFNPGEYLEMLLPIKEAVLALREGNLEMQETVQGIREEQRLVRLQLATHTEQDATNFDRLAALVEAQF